MPEVSDRELDDQLAELERDLGPTLRRVYVGARMRPGFTTERRTDLTINWTRRPVLHMVGQRAWAATAAVLAVSAVVGVAVFANRPQPVSAADVVDQLQNEAFTMSASVAGPGCGAPPAGAQKTTGGIIAMQSGGARGAPSMSTGPTTLANANELSDKLAAALGISADQVRAAMLATVREDMPTSLPLDPMVSIANQLGLNRDQVCTAFFEGPGAIVGLSLGNGVPAGNRPGPELNQGNDMGPGLNLNTATADQLKGPAQKLGVSPERLLAAVKASIPSTPSELPKKANPDQIISRFAQNLGLPEDKVRAAITKVEGNNGFYFAVQIPGLSH